MKSVPLPQKTSEVKISWYKKLCRKKWFRILRPVIIIALVILLVYILTILGVFKIKKIETKEDLQYVQNLSKVTNKYLGVGYFILDLDEMEKDITDSFKYVKDVTAQKIFPNKILLEIEEYQPSLYFEYKDVCYILSEKGIILEQNEEYEECILDDGIKLNSQQNILAEEKLIFGTELWEVLKLLEEFDWETTEVKFDKDILEVMDGTRIITIEIDDEYETQLSRLYLVLEKANIEGIEYRSLDLRFERPVMELL
jgi:hypothetical protein